jgi:hypothetical protein
MLFGMGALGLGGLAVTGGGIGGPDAEAVVWKPRQEVYAAVSQMAQEGERFPIASAEAPPVSLKVEKEPGEAVRYKVIHEGQVLAQLEFGMEDVQSGAGTRLTAGLDFDRAALRTMLGEDAADLPPIPESMIRLGLRQAVAEMAMAIEAGRPLPSLTDMELANWTPDLPGPREHAAAARVRQQALTQPMATTEPMVDPNEAARNYLSGQTP